MINGHRNISEVVHGSFALPLIGLTDMVEQGDFDNVEHLAESIAQMARLRRLGRAADKVGNEGSKKICHEQVGKTLPRKRSLL